MGLKKKMPGSQGAELCSGLLAGCVENGLKRLPAGKGELWLREKEK
jgi:hypothetical protein